MRSSTDFEQFNLTNSSSDSSSCALLYYKRSRVLQRSKCGDNIVIVTFCCIMATQFVKWWRTKFHNSSSSSSSASSTTSSDIFHSHKCAYKTMSVLGSDTSDGGRHSDTEDLVRDDTSSCNAGHVNAGLVSSSSESSDFSHHGHNGVGGLLRGPGNEDDEDLAHHVHGCCSPSNNNTNRQDVKFEDFECDVHLHGEGISAGEENESGTDEERKEFSFTFYDLDGHGKITKDDIAGLVRSIYGAVNDSITVPQGGKKTIKVRLTVSPEQQKQQLSTNINQNKINNNNNDCNYEEIIKTGTIVETENRLSGNVNPNQTSAVQDGDINENGGSDPLNKPKANSNNNQSGKMHRSKGVRFSNNHIKSNLDRFMKFNSSSAACPDCHQHRQHNILSKPMSTGDPEVLRDYSGGTPMKHRKKWRERILTDCCPQLAKPQLFDLLQANMEKNNVSPCCRIDYSKLEMQNNYRQQQHFHSQQTSPAHHLCSHNHLIDPKCPILPLLNINNNNNVDPSVRSSAKISNNNNNINDTHYHNHHQNQLSNRIKYSTSAGHHRSRSHDISQNLFKYELLNAAGVEHSNLKHQKTCKCSNIQNASATTNYHHEESLEILTSGCVLNSSNSPRHVTKNTNHNLSNSAHQHHHHHQLKHRNREQEHARAMAQVINWLEREQLGISGNNEKFCSSSPRKNLHQQHSSPFNNCLNGSPTEVKKHHHHHEHVHHHYHHHYNNNNSSSSRSKETPIIV